MVDFLQAATLGVIQGLTEFLPVSSSGHLAIFAALFGWDDPGAAFTAVSQIGTELAVVLYFWRDIVTIAKGWLAGLRSPEARQAPEWTMGWFIIVGSLPIVVLGLALEDWIDSRFRNLWIIATMLIALGLLLGYAERIGRKNRPIEKLTWKHAITLGFAQAGALVPGVSRSGATITAGMMLGYERAAATRYAFLLAVPAVLGAGVYKLKDIGEDSAGFTWGPTILGTAIAFVVGLAVIHWLLRYISTHSYRPFVIYRVMLGAGVIVLLAAGVIESVVTF